ncbi:unnamed protein product, partial [Amoebophrya sp. A120]|eukprot:GSA120T00002007001.1
MATSLRQRVSNADTSKGGRASLVPSDHLELSVAYESNAFGTSRESGLHEEQKRPDEEMELRTALCGASDLMFTGKERPMDSSDLMHKLQTGLANGVSLLRTASEEQPGSAQERPLTLLQCAIRAGNLDAVQTIAQAMTQQEWTAHEVVTDTLLFALQHLVQAETSTRKVSDQRDETGLRGIVDPASAEPANYEVPRGGPQYEEIVNFLRHNFLPHVSSARALDSLLKLPPRVGVFSPVLSATPRAHGDEAMLDSPDATAGGSWFPQTCSL